MELGIHPPKPPLGKPLVNNTNNYITKLIVDGVQQEHCEVYVFQRTDNVWKPPAYKIVDMQIITKMSSVLCVCTRSSTGYK
jgi:hypothetical protein